MMQIRPIRPGEIDSFAAFGTQPERIPSIRDYLTDMFDRGAMCPEWCFVAEDDGRLTGRLGFWTLPGERKPLAFVLCDVPWHGEYLETGRRLLQQSLKAARDIGADRIDHVIDSPPVWPQWQEHREQRIELLESLGFTMERETARFEWRGDGEAAVDQRLTYRSLDDVGEDAFVAALASVSANSLDQRTREERERSGSAAEARETFEDLQGMEYEPAWWQLAYADGSDLVGLVMPTVAPTFGTIGYIGVVPEQRGRGYINDLLAQGTQILRETGAVTFRADTDVNNTPMANAFRRAGWEQFATRREYAVDLTAL